MNLPGDTVSRFDDRVEDYVRHRPDYPSALADWLRDQGALRPGLRVADVGAGTGISTAMLLDAQPGIEAIAVEPNARMREACAHHLAGRDGWRIVGGRADALGLDARSVDLVVAAQAFHWFDRAAFRAECARVLRPGGHVAVFWNTRRTGGTPFLDGYEALLREHTDYAQVAERYDGDDDMRAWLGDAFVASARFPHAQRLDREGLRGRFLSSSYAPRAGHPRHEAAMRALDALFDATAVDGAVSLDYDTRVFLGRAPVASTATAASEGATPGLPPALPPVPATPAPTHSGAVVSLVFGVLSWLLIPFIGALVAVVAGHLARRDIRAAGGRLQGDGLALGGLVLGWVQLVSLFLGALLIGGLLLLGGTALLLGFLL